ncbi:hypothetical protein MKZ38_000376 [Zalerion maritima]|uniref:Uncharacterized protein n=1 Tax=Zalerion maritima TaxID=339359 RepID=A0AAD5WS26_9PEZI|nr:hypothetical protein MKZ38_000376 [Zalerion maritima]
MREFRDGFDRARRRLSWWRFNPEGTRQPTLLYPDTTDFMSPHPPATWHVDDATLGIFLLPEDDEKDCPLPGMPSDENTVRVEPEGPSDLRLTGVYRDE